MKYFKVFWLLMPFTALGINIGFIISKRTDINLTSSFFLLTASGTAIAILGVIGFVSKEMKG